MSLFSISGGGEIWSSAGFAFVSPINDILDKDDFTLEEILAQDEVLQEVKSLNVKLVEFLCKEESVRQMMAYIAEAPPAGASDERVFKFPYMSCEIVCCEVPHILNAVANDNDSTAAPLSKLFSMLDEDGDMDAHRAGYLEKILTVLLKHKCAATTKFLNDGGLELFRKMVRHLGNFSVMQVARLLLLPKHAALQEIDAAALMGDGRGPDGADGFMSPSQWCNWSEAPEILQTLLREFSPTGAGDDSAESGRNRGAATAAATGQTDGKTEEGKEDVATGGEESEEDIGERSDVHTHLSELLLALIAQSSPESAFLKRMFSAEAVDPLVSAAKLTKEQGREAKGSQAALQILAALVNRVVQPQPPSASALLQGRGVTMDMQVDFDNFEGSASGSNGEEIRGGREDDIEGAGSSSEGGSGRHSPSLRRPLTGRESLQVDLDVLERGLKEVVPFLCAYLRGHTEDPSMISVQIKEEQPRLGSLRLQVVRFLETLVGMDNRAIDQVLIAEAAMATFLEMMFTYESSSMLHASVSGAVLSILGASPLPPPPVGLDEAMAAAWVAETTEAARLAANSGRREPFQRHLFEDCRLAERLLEAVAVNEDAERGPKEVTPAMAAAVAAVGNAPAAAVEGGSGSSDVETAEKAVTEESGDTPEVSPPDDAISTPDGVVEEGDASPGADQAAAAAAAAAAGGEGSAGKADPAAAVAVPGGEEEAEAAASVATDDEEKPRIARRGRRLGHMGHVILLSRAIVDAQNKEPREGLTEEAGVRGDGGAGGESEGRGDVNRGAGDGGKVGSTGEEREDEGDWAGVAPMEKEGPAARKSFVAGLMARRECAEQWQEFVSTTLAEQLERQLNPLGGFTVPSREDENQLSSDFPDEAVDMDDTTGILENLARMHSSSGLAGGQGLSQQQGRAGNSGAGGAMNDTGDVDDDIDFEGMDSAAGGGGSLSNNNALSMMFGSGNFMSSSGGGSAWGSLMGVAGSSTGGGDGGDGGSTFGEASSGVNEGWANFADFDFADPQPAAPPTSSNSTQSATGAGGGSSNSSGGFATFDSVFAIDSSSTPGGMDPGPGPNVFAPSPPTWGSSSGQGGGADGAGARASNAGSGGGGGGGGGGGFAEFPQYGGFADFSAMMDDTASPPAPINISPPATPTRSGGGGSSDIPSTPPLSGASEGMESSPDPQAFSTDGSGVAGGADPDDRMEDDTDERGPAEQSTALPAGAAEGVAPGGVGSQPGDASPPREAMDSLEAMVGSDDGNDDAASP